MENSGHELATVIDNFLEPFNAKHKLPAHKLKTLNALQKCRTDYMGGHIEACSGCGLIRLANNSCRNRHCPKCGAIDKQKWIIDREADLLPVKYFHVVFTVPDKLNHLFIINQVEMYNALFKVVWDVMKSFGLTRKWLGGKIGATAILHTTGQNLSYHPHLHLIVPAGALMPNGKWKHARNRGKYLFDVKQLSHVFRARFVAKTRELANNGKVTGKLPPGLFDKDWVVYAKQPFGGPKHVIRYLGKYTHRTAISNDRILCVDDNMVTFTWKDYRSNYKKQVTSIIGERFLQLFCMHILPPGFTRIRHYGFLSPVSKTKSLELIRKSLKVKPPVKVENKKHLALKRLGIKPGVCIICGGKIIIIQTIPNQFYPNQRAPPKLIL
jgi:hypothetical protein